VNGTGVRQSTDEDSEIRQRRSHAPVHQEFTRQIGADAYAPNAATAVDRVKELLNIA
jgi:hypothetical protein